jgi:hypothetical protein
MRIHFFVLQVTSGPKLTNTLEKNEVFSRQFNRPWSIRTFLFLTIMAFAVAAAPEELVKALTGYPLARDRSLAWSKRIYVWACLSASIGFSTAENFGYVFSVPSSELGMRIGRYPRPLLKCSLFSLMPRANCQLRSRPFTADGALSHTRCLRVPHWH